MIPRTQTGNIRQGFGKGKAVVVIGPCQVGKTTLVRQITQTLDRKTLWLTGDDPETRSLFDNIGLARLQTLIGQNEVVVVDEAQRFTNAGLMLKLDLAAQTKESLTGRKFEYPLYPLSFVEMTNHHGYLAEHALLEHRMLYGYYPEVVQNDPPRAQKILNDLSDGLMYKDLLSLDQIKKPSLLVKLLQALALQVGSEVSYPEIAQLIGADPLTVEKYTDLLEQSFVVFRLPSLSRNARNEIKKGRKIYFYDNGIRNAILKNFSPLALRADTGALWENFLLAERMKRNAYTDYFCNTYFWRTTSQQEIDYVEDTGGRLYAFEFKWQAKKPARFPAAFLENYPGSQATMITKENFDAFIGLP
ncbi:MAG: ATP-binding protein [Lewinellaceae bacterium]|nr:ATP-binding protein [Lewinellaceae bacterium]